MKIQNIDFNNKQLNIQWADGHNSVYHTMWLRDNDQSETSKHANGQRLFNITDIPKDISIKQAQVNGENLEVTFDPENHLTGTYDLSWLRDNCYSQEHSEKDFTYGYTPKFWTANDFKQITKHDFTECQKSDKALEIALADFVDYGWTLFKNVPAMENSVFDVIDLFGFVRETNYGKLFDVKVVNDPNNLAFTNASITPHTDNPYRNPTPSIQLLCCLTNEAKGGESGMVDGFTGAEKLRAENPEYFELLSTYYVPYQFNANDARLHNRQPIINVDDNSNVVGVAFNNRSVNAFNVPAEKMEKFYEAYRRFAEILFSDEMQLNFKLESGECLVFDNIRTLHARTGFEEGGDRHIQGSYADRDALFSKYLLLKSQNNQG